MDNKEQPLTDKCPMPLGNHKGKPMEEVPAQYLLWYRDNARHRDARLLEYIDDNKEILEREVAQGK